MLVVRKYLFDELIKSFNESKHPRGEDGRFREKGKKLSESGGDSGGILDKSIEKQEAYAKSVYTKIRNISEKEDIEKVAKSSGLDYNSIKEIRDHVFVNKHQLSNGFKRFAEDVNIANAWEALEQGRPKSTDILLLRHELEELTLMKEKGYDYEKAHWTSNLKYPWQFKVDEKYKGWTDDQILAEVKRQLDLLL